MGSAADLVEATGAQVLAGALDAPFVQGTAPEPEAVLTPRNVPSMSRFWPGSTRRTSPP